MQFFSDAFGTTRLFSLVRKNDPPLDAHAIGAKNGLPKGVAIVAISMLRFGNGANLEVFEIDWPRRTDAATIGDIGSISHFSVTGDDIDAATARFEAAGGSLLEGPTISPDKRKARAIADASASRPGGC